MNIRRGALFALLAATLAAAWWVGGEEEASESDAIQAVRHAPARASAMPSVASSALPSATPAPEPRFPVGGPDMFPAQSWRPPPPPPVAVVTPPPPPMAPPLPFKYVGRWVDDQGENVFLALGEKVLIARAGQKLEQWRLDKVDADQLGFTYLPLDQQRQLRLTP